MKTEDIFMMHQAIAAAAGFLLFTLLLYYLENRRKPKQDAHSNCDSTDYQKPSTFDGRQKHPSDEEHRSAEQAFWRWQMDVEKRQYRIAVVTLLISVAAIVAAGLSFWESRIQADAAQGQITAMRDAQRAWLKVSLIDGVSATSVKR